MDPSEETNSIAATNAQPAAHARRGRHGADAAPAVDEPERVPDVINLPALVRAAVADGPVWTHTSTDLNVNLIVVNGPGGVPDHTNDEVDVVFIGVEGTGTIVIDGVHHQLTAGSLVIVPKGTRRGLTVTEGRCAYVTCHRRRTPLWPRGIARTEKPST